MSLRVHAFAEYFSCGLGLLLALCQNAGLCRHFVPFSDTGVYRTTALAWWQAWHRTYKTQNHRNAGWKGPLEIM